VTIFSSNKKWSYHDYKKYVVTYMTAVVWLRTACGGDDAETGHGDEGKEFQGAVVIMNTMKGKNPEEMAKQPWTAQHHQVLQQGVRLGNNPSSGHTHPPRSVLTRTDGLVKVASDICDPRSLYLVMSL